MRPLILSLLALLTVSFVAVPMAACCQIEVEVTLDEEFTESVAKTEQRKIRVSDRNDFYICQVPVLGGALREDGLTRSLVNSAMTFPLRC